MLSEHPFFLSKIQKLSIRWGKKSNQPTNKPFLRVGFLRVTSHNYDALGAVAQIPIILTGSKVSLLNLEMEMLYLFSSLVIVSLESVYNLFVFLSRSKCKIYTGVNIIWYFFCTIYISVNIFWYVCPIYTIVLFTLCYQCQYILIPGTPTSSTDPHPQLVKRPPTKLEIQCWFDWSTSTSKYIETSMCSPDTNTAWNTMLVQPPNIL